MPISPCNILRRLGEEQVPETDRMGHGRVDPLESASDNYASKVVEFGDHTM